MISAPLTDEVERMAGRTQRWIVRIVEGLDEKTDPETCAQTLEACGRQRAPKGLIRTARDIYRRSKNIGEFLAPFSVAFEALRLEDGNVYVVYPTSYCQQIKGIPVDDVRDAYCSCSVGWVEQVFESALDPPIGVRRVKSIVSGDDECRFRIDLG